MPRCCAVQPESKWPITHVRDGTASYPQSSSGAGVDFERISEIELWMNQQALNEWIVYESTVKVSCHNSSPRYMTTSDGSEMMSWKDWTKHLCPITYLKYGSTHSLHFHWMRQYKGHLSNFISINPNGCHVSSLHHYLQLGHALLDAWQKATASAHLALWPFAFRLPQMMKLKLVVACRDSQTQSSKAHWQRNIH